MSGAATGDEVRALIIQGLPPPHGHYSHLVSHGGLAYLSGVLGNAGLADASPARSVAEQTRYCLETLEAMLLHVGTQRQRVLRLTIYTPDVEYWAAINAQCAEFFGAHRPARTIVPCGPLRLGSSVEIDGVAALNRSD